MNSCRQPAAGSCDYLRDVRTSRIRSRIAWTPSSSKCSTATPSRHLQILAQPREVIGEGPVDPPPPLERELWARIASFLASPAQHIGVVQEPDLVVVGEPGRRQTPGPVIALAVVGVVLVLGGLFLWLGPLSPDENTSVWVSSAQGAVARVDAGSSRLLDVIPITDGNSGVLIEGLASSDRYLSIAPGVAGPARLRRRDPGATRARTTAAHRRLDG